MKRLLLTAACLLVATGTAQAGPDWQGTIHPYVGFDLTRTHYDYNSSYDLEGFTLDGNRLLEKNLNGLNFHIGNRFTRYFGAELGYMRTQGASKSIAEDDEVGPGVFAAADFKTKVRTQAVTLDALGYLPLGDGDRFDLIGTAGLTWTKAKLTLSVPGLGGDSVNDSEWGWRAGAGAQVNITPRIGLRGLARYQRASFDDVADHAVVYTAGLNYSF